MTNLRLELAKAKNNLLAHGWKYSHCMCHADNDLHYGSLYYFQHLQLYINKDTIANPQAHVFTIFNRGTSTGATTEV